MSGINACESTSVDDRQDGRRKPVRDCLPPKPRALCLQSALDLTRKVDGAEKENTDCLTSENLNT